MRTKALIPAALVMLLALGTSTALADYDFEGDASGSWGDVNPWANWQGTLYTGANPYFSGYWGGDTDNWIYGDATYNSQTGLYVVSGGANDQWAYGNSAAGYWEGYFYPSGDTADGTWWTSDEKYSGYWWGNLAD